MSEFPLDRVEARWLVRELSAWLSEKLSRIKLGGQSENSLRTFEALEFLQLGIHHNTNFEAYLKYLYRCSFAPRMAMNAREALLHDPKDRGFQFG